MNRPWIGAMVLASQVLVSCGEVSSMPVANSGIERFGLQESPVDHPLVFLAIERANAILPSDSQRFAPGWMPGLEATAIPVYAIRGQLAANEIIAIYSECRCIVVQTNALDAWFKAKVGSGPALLTVEPRLFLSYMLLHEAGHVVRDGSVENATTSGAQPSAAGFNLNPTVQKMRESAADLFAAEAIRSALHEGGDRGLAAAELAMVLSQLSWNLAAHRLLDDFGGTALRKPSLFWDAGTSHPNLEGRLLVVNDLVAGTDASRQLLEDFVKARVAGPDSILWQPEE